MYGLFHLAVLSATALSASALPQQQEKPGVNADFICPPEDMKRTHCMGPFDCLYALPGNCLGYIQCQPKDETYETGIAYERPCRAGQWWNDEKKYCDTVEPPTCKAPVVPASAAPAPAPAPAPAAPAAPASTSPC
uniref:Avr4 n=1 Tax=Cercospora nicotianae TaxID=29003 RepID=D5KLB4_CERNC|nr:Avr4 precursor [Cercospora nicotianae]